MSVISTTSEATEILLAEDECDLRELLCELLESAGWRVTCAADGRDALVHLRRGMQPALALVDLRMPIMDGMELIAAMRADPSLAAIPIVLHTAEPPARVPAGVTRVLRKPVDAGTLLDALGQ
jgi:CheY-like chemotaxis protein